MSIISLLNDGQRKLNEILTALSLAAAERAQFRAELEAIKALLGADEPQEPPELPQEDLEALDKISEATESLRDKVEGINAEPPSNT